MTTTPGLYKGVIDGFKTIAAKEGPAALFRGIALGVVAQLICPANVQSP